MRGTEREAGMKVGMEIAREFIDRVRDRVNGFYIIPPFGRYWIARELLAFIKE